MKRVVYVLTALLLLSGCSGWGGNDEEPLPGERISILELQRRLTPDSQTPSPLELPAPWQNEFWPQAGGYPNHAMQHLALNGNELQPVWSAKIGQGKSKALPLTAQPVIADGMVFTLDTRSTLSAFSVKDGAELWQVDVSDPEEDDPVIGGGIGYARGILYITAGYDEVLAVKAADGSLVWRVTVPSPARAAPTVTDERIFISTLDNRILALSSGTGQTLWEFAGIPQAAGLVGAASPAAGREIVVPAFSSGEVFALRIENGSVAWSDNLSSFGAQASGLGSLSDIRGFPVIDKGLVFAISFGGRMAAIEERTGTRVWQRDIGSAETPWIAGNYLFVISTDNELVSINNNTGAIGWVAQLPRFADEDRDEPLFWTNPILAGGRLILAGSNGDVVEASPQDGSIIRSWSAGRGISIAPAVAGGTLYLLGNDGTLMAYR